MRKRKNTPQIIVGLIIVAFFLIWLGTRTGTAPPVNTAASPEALPGIQAGNAPWPAEASHLAERLRAISLPLLETEGTALHIHQHLDIFIDGKSVPIPPNIGIASNFIAPIHVHDETGIIHVESPTVQTFTLGQFFDTWGVAFTKECLGAYCSGNGKTLTIFVNGSPYAGNARELALEAHQEIAIVYGAQADLPQTIPSSYFFPPGY